MVDGIHRPILPYQTRILRLHGGHGDSRAPLVCDLLVGDLLHSKFESVGLRSLNCDSDRLQSYEALSYAWEGQSSAETILCNGTTHRITRNVFQALRALRSTCQQPRYLWIDSICINQNDDKEKSVQVQNMLQIYQTAMRVIAWLGDHDEYGIALDDEDVHQRNVDQQIRAMEHIYKHPWFQRVWIQQEAFAARDLLFNLGKKQITWLQIRTRHSQLAKYHSTSQVGDSLEHALMPLDALFSKLSCFDRVQQRPARPLDIVDALMEAAALQATDPRDFIYGIIGITSYPTKSMTVAQWRKHPDSSTFVPIDYSAQYPTITAIVTRNIAMISGGWHILSKFKTERYHDIELGKTSPSWAIDWRISRTLVHRNSLNYGTCYKMSSLVSSSYLPQRLGLNNRFSQCISEANDNAHNDPHTLRICGIALENVRWDGRYIENSSETHSTRQGQIEASDIVVRVVDHSLAGLSMDYQAYLDMLWIDETNIYSWGYVVLKPTEKNKFKVVTFAYPGFARLSLYQNWEDRPIIRSDGTGNYFIDGNIFRWYDHGSGDMIYSSKESDLLVEERIIHGERAGLNIDGQPRMYHARVYELV